MLNEFDSKTQGWAYHTTTDDEQTNLILSKFKLVLKDDPKNLRIKHFMLQDECGEVQPQSREYKDALDIYISKKLENYCIQILVLAKELSLKYLIITVVRNSIDGIA